MDQYTENSFLIEIFNELNLILKDFEHFSIWELNCEIDQVKEKISEHLEARGVKHE